MSTPDRLTDEEREELFQAGSHHPEHCACSAYVIEQAFAEDDCCQDLLDTFAAVERILAARLAAQPPATDRVALAEVRTLDHVECQFWRESEQRWEPRVVIQFGERPTRWRYRAARETLLRSAWRSTEQEARADLAARPAPDTLADRVQALLDRWERDGLACGCGHALGEHNGFGCYAVLSYTPTRVSCTCKEDDDRNDVVFATRDLRALLAGRSDASPEGGEQRG